MKIWEAIIYGIFGGMTELLPVSFNGHYTFLRGTFNLSSLTEGAGYYIRAAICLGVIAALLFGFSGELHKTKTELSYVLGIRKPGRGYQKDRLTRRTMSLLFFALLPLLLSLFFRGTADRMIHLLYTALIFLGNGLFLFLCFHGSEGRKEEKEREGEEEEGRKEKKEKRRERKGEEKKEEKAVVQPTLFSSLTH